MKLSLMWASVTVTIYPIAQQIRYLGAFYLLDYELKSQLQTYATTIYIYRGT